MAQTRKPAALERLTLSGEPRERGVTHGEAFADEVAANVERYLSVFAHYGADRETVYDQAEQFVDVIEDANADYFAEMEGVAEGAGVDLLDVTVLNARWEVMYSAYAEAAEAEMEAAAPDGCTAFGAQPEITGSGRTLIGQNWDWIPDIDVFLQEVRGDDAPDSLTMTEAGIVGGKVGLNEHGIGMLVNGLVAEGDGDQPFRTPYHVRFREAMNADTLHGAIQPLIETDRANSANVLLGHESGEMIDLELAPTVQNYLYPEDGLLTHANHFEERDRVNSEFERIATSTLCREPRLRRLLSNQSGSIDVETAQDALRDHVGKPASVCMHPDESAPEPERSRTNVSAAMDLERRELYATYGPPCENEYRRFALAS
jgi:isopenicillin-N N-acyltransferase-like protein